MGPFDAIWLSAAIRLSTPLVLAASGELIAQRAGIINIGLEGMILAGAFFSFLASWGLHSFWLGVLAGMGAGALLAAIMALLSINARADQIVVGVGINVLALGITTFFFRQIFSDQAQVVLPVPNTLELHGLSRIPVVGTALFNQTALVYVAFLFVVVVWFVMYKTTWGLALRAAGEVPAAADTAGTSVHWIRWIGTLTAGAAAGLAGAFLSIGQLGLFVERMSAGRGFIALAVVIFGGWRPWRVMTAGVVFGSADALQLRIQSDPAIPRQLWAMMAIIAFLYVLSRLRPHVRHSAIEISVGIGIVAVGVALFVVAPNLTFPPQFWLSIPYIVALLALAGIVGRVRMPSALAIPYRRGGES